MNERTFQSKTLKQKNLSCLESEESQSSWKIVSKGKVAENEGEYYAGPCHNLIRSRYIVQFEKKISIICIVQTLQIRSCQTLLN